MGERNIQTEILLQFGARPDMRIWRVNTGMAYGYSVVKNALARAGCSEILKTMQPVRYGAPGTPDIQGILEGGRAIGIEVKKPGETLSDEQRAWRKMFVGLGGFFIEAHSPEEVSRELLHAGIL